MDERIVVTGMGTLNPVGGSVKESWDNVISGVSGVAPITLFDASELRVKIAGEVKNFTPGDYLSHREVRRLDRVQQLNSIAAREAINQAGLIDAGYEPERISVIVSSAIGGMGSLEENFQQLLVNGPQKVSPFAITKLMINGSAAQIAIDYGYQGPSFSVVSACSTGADNLGMAWSLLKSGMIDVAVAGAGEAPITLIGVVAFDRLGAVSRDNENYSITPRPFDKTRNGLVIGEAAAILVLERESIARKRGASILAEFSGYASTEDAFHITAPSEEGKGGARAIKNALASGGIDSSEVDYINAHGTATILNDLSETKAVKYAFGDAAYTIPISSTKSMTGHTMGAAGALEAIFSIMAIRENIVPPTINYSVPDPDCDLDFVPNHARELPLRTVVSNSFGFGGHNAVLVMQEY